MQTVAIAASDAEKRNTGEKMLLICDFTGVCSAAKIELLTGIGIVACFAAFGRLPLTSI
jgi:hypothetical protein